MDPDIKDHEASENTAFESSGNVSAADRNYMYNNHDADRATSTTGTETSAFDPDPEKDRTRETWSNKIDFLLACIGFSVGLGNVWRFPYLCYKNGGGAFVFAYLICVLVGGIPMFFLEVALGQFMSEGGIMAWNICPIFRGIGFATTVIVFFLNVYYNVILAWAFYYLFSSFTVNLPWSHCGNWWNDPDRCTTDFSQVILSRKGNASGLLDNDTLSTLNGSFVHPVTEFWEKKVLAISDGIETPGILKWDLTLCLLLAWVVVYVCICKGIRTSGKVMYFTATSPYVLMFILMIRGVTLEGAADGLIFYLKPDFEKIKETKVWVDAGTQIFFSYSISLGALTALGSYNKFKHNSFRDCIIFAGVNSGTSIFSGFVIFSTIGYMAHAQGVSVAEVAESGPGLAFIAYPLALSKMPVAPLWAIMFFFMVILLGLDSEFVGVEGFITALSDMFPKFMRRGYNRELFTAASCFVCFLIGLSMVTEGGMYVFQLFDFYTGSRIILLVAFLECVAIAGVYGVDRFIDNLEMMYGYTYRRSKPEYTWKWMWLIVTPIFCVVMFILSAVNYSALDYSFADKKVYHYPGWSVGIGWVLACSSIVFVPIVAFGMVMVGEGDLMSRIRQAIRPRLRPHQMRPQDDPLDLDPEYLANGRSQDIEDGGTPPVQMQQVTGNEPVMPGAYNPPPSYNQVTGNDTAI